MKRAICFYGQLRTWSYTKNNWITFIKNNNLDVYICTWNKWKDQDIDIDFFKELNPVSIILENFDDYYDKPYEIHQVRMPLKSLLTINLEYDYILIARFDSIWHNLPEDIPENTICNSYSFGGGFPGDWGFYGRFKDLIKLFNKVDIFKCCPHQLIDVNSKKYEINLLTNLHIIIYRYTKRVDVNMNNGQIHLNEFDEIIT